MSYGLLGPISSRNYQYLLRKLCDGGNYWRNESVERVLKLSILPVFTCVLNGLACFTQKIVEAQYSLVDFRHNRKVLTHSQEQFQ